MSFQTGKEEITNLVIELKKYTSELEQIKLEEFKLLEKKKKRLRYKIIALCIGVVAVAIFTFTYITVFIPMKKYDQAMTLYNNNELVAAKDIFTEITDYKNSSDMIVEIEYLLADGMLKNEKYLEAAELYDKIGEYKDSRIKMSECYYKEGMRLFEELSYDKAAEYFVLSEDFEDSKEKYILCNYSLGETHFESRGYADAVGYYIKAGDYEDAAEKLNLCKYMHVLDNFDEKSVEYLSDLSSIFYKWDEAGSYLSEGSEIRLSTKLNKDEFDFESDMGEIRAVDNPTYLHVFTTGYTEIDIGYVVISDSRNPSHSGTLRHVSPESGKPIIWENIFLNTGNIKMFFYDLSCNGLIGYREFNILLGAKRVNNKHDKITESNRIYPAYAAATSQIYQENHDNSVWAIMDGSSETSWQEGVNGYGIGESINFDFEEIYYVKYFTFQLGNWRNEDYFLGNSRPKALTLILDDYPIRIEFPDSWEEFYVELTEGYPISQIQVIIDDVYMGANWDDTCIAEIGVYKE